MSDPYEPLSTVPDEPTGPWTGWVVFAGVAMVLLGCLNLIHGLAGLLRGSWFGVSREAALGLDLSAWAWVLVLLGGVVAVAGLGVLAGQLWARIVGVLAALGNAVVHMFVLPTYPAWSLIAIALDVVVIYALTVHGAALNATRPEA